MRGTYDETAADDCTTNSTVSTIRKHHLLPVVLSGLRRNGAFTYISIEMLPVTYYEIDPSQQGPCGCSFVLDHFGRLPCVYSPVRVNLCICLACLNFITFTCAGQLVQIHLTVALLRMAA